MRVIEKKIFSVLMMFILLISTGICLAEEPVAERPIYTKGDFWVFVNSNQFKKMKQTFLREEKNKYVFRLGKSDRTSHYYFISDVTTGATGDTILAQHKVESYEPVTVPAGTFQALKISVIIESSETIVTIPEKMYFWYAPEVKQIIKRIMMGKTWELKKYKIK
jgi:hypothetical protein